MRPNAEVILGVKYIWRESDVKDCGHVRCYLSRSRVYSEVVQSVLRLGRAE
jgi:hypothetical protein